MSANQFRIRFFSILLLIVGVQACYYDNEEDLYPISNETGCDTTAISYSQFVSTLISQHCLACHSGSTPSGNISLASYDDIKALAQNGRLMGVLRHDAGFSPMPKGSNKLPDCDIKKVAAWIGDGAKNN